MVAGSIPAAEIFFEAVMLITVLLPKWISRFRFITQSY